MVRDDGTDPPHHPQDETKHHVGDEGSADAPDRGRNDVGVPLADAGSRRRLHVGGPLRLDARILVWLLALVFATGLPLMILFDADAGAHARRLGPWVWLRHLHAASTLALMAGVVWHLLARWRGSLAGTRSGAWLLASVGLATLTGALAAQTGDADRLAQIIGMPRAPTVLAAVGHIAYATILVLLTLYLHVARWGWRRVFGDWRHLGLALLPTLAIALLLPVDPPGGDGGGTTAWLAPPWPALAAWPILLALGAWGARRLRT